jgi:hypothetical protein
LTVAPPPVSRILVPAAWITCIVASALMFITHCQSSSVMSKKSAYFVTPAQSTTVANLPPIRIDAATAAATAVRSRRSTGDEFAANAFGDSRSPLLVVIGDDDAVAAGGEPLADRGADSSSTAGDQVGVLVFAHRGSPFPCV